MFTVLLTGPAQQDLQHAHDWWAENRSREQAARWHRGVVSAIKSLSSHPERRGLAPESGMLPAGIRQLLYGLGSRPTHRVLYTIDDERVVVLRVRHVAQASLTVEDLPPE